MRDRITVIVMGILILSLLMRAHHYQESIKIFSTLEEAVPRESGVVMLVFFSMDCYSCYSDLFEMRHIVRKNAWPVAIVGVTSGLREELRVFCEKFSWTLPVVLDQKKKLSRKHGVSFVPYKVLIISDEVVYRDDPYQDYQRRRENIAGFLAKVFSLGRRAEGDEGSLTDNPGAGLKTRGVFEGRGSLIR